MTTTLNVQFADQTDAAIVSVFGCPQPSSTPNQGQISSSDARYETFYNALPVAVQSALVAPGG